MTKGVLKISQILQESTTVEVSFLTKLQVRGLQLYSKRDLAQVFSWKFCNVFKSTLLYRTSAVATFDLYITLKGQSVE